MCFLLLHWDKKLDRVVWFQIFVYFLYVHEWDVLCMFCAHYPCIIYQHMIVICTHLHKALSVCTYAVILCHIWFFYTCACVRFCQKTMKSDTYYYQIDSMCVCLSKCECYDFITLFFFQYERNKSPSRKQLSALWSIKWRWNHICTLAW